MTELAGAIDQVAAATDFSGVVGVDRDGGLELVRAYGLAHRGWAVQNEVDTRFGIVSGTKSLTALVMASLVEDGLLDLATTARCVLGPDLPLINDGVTVEHLLAHRSGSGDYFDENTVQPMTDYVMSVPVRRLVTTSDYLAVLDAHPQVFPPGDRFVYSNGGFVVLALIAGRVGGTPFAELVRTRVCEPAGMRDTAFLRSDEPASRWATSLATACGPTCRTSRSAAAATAGSSARRRTSARCGRRCTPAGSCPGIGWRSCCARAATCRLSPPAMGWVSGCARRARRWSWTGPMQGSPSRGASLRRRRRSAVREKGQSLIVLCPVAHVRDSPVRGGAIPTV